MTPLIIVDNYSLPKISCGTGASEPGKSHSVSYSRDCWSRQRTCIKSILVQECNWSKKGENDGQLMIHNTWMVGWGFHLTTYTWFQKVQDVGSARPRTDRVQVHTRTTFGDRSFAAAGPRLWNSLPVHLSDEDIRYDSFTHKRFGFNVASGTQCDVRINCAAQILLLKLN